MLWGNHFTKSVISPVQMLHSLWIKDSHYSGNGTLQQWAGASSWKEEVPRTQSFLSVTVLACAVSEHATSNAKPPGGRTLGPSPGTLARLQSGVLAHGAAAQLSTTH